MAQNDTFWQHCEAIANDTAETIAIDSAVNYLRINSGINDLVYVKFNWATGDDEVSATDFDICLSVYGSVELKNEAPSWPRLKNVRVICATGGSIAFLGW